MLKGLFVVNLILVSVRTTIASANHTSGSGGGAQDAGTHLASSTYNQTLIAVSLVCGILLVLNLVLCPLAVVLAVVKQRRQKRKQELAQARREMLERQETWFQENEEEQLVQPTGGEENPDIKQAEAAES